VIGSTLDIDKDSLPEKLFGSLVLATTVTPLEGKVVVVAVGMEVVVDAGEVVDVVEVVVGDVVVVGETVVVVVPVLKVVVVVRFGVLAPSAPSHAFGVPKTTGVAPTGAATRTLPDPSILILK